MVRARIGALDVAVTLRRYALVDDGAGGATTTSTDYASVWAKREPLSGSEKLNDQRIEAQVSVLFTLYRRDDVKPSDRIVADGIEHNIIFIRPSSPRDQFMQVECSQGVRA